MGSIENGKVNSLGSFKSAGEDFIFPALLPKSIKHIKSNLLRLYTASLKLNYIPKSWKGTLVTFIPELGKGSYQEAKSYRPISLMSFVLKTLEKKLDYKIRSHINTILNIHFTHHCMHIKKLKAQNPHYIN